MNRKQTKKLAIPIGDSNGIGPEITIKTVARYSDRKDIRLTVFGPRSVIEKTAHALGMEQLLEKLDVVPTLEIPSSSYMPGLVNADAGRSAVDAATQAIRAVQRGEYDAIVAAPHHETAIAMAGIKFSGYPSLVASVCDLPAEEVFMLLIGGGLRIVHVTLHEGVETALRRLTPDLIVKATIAGVSAVRRLGIQNPRVAVMGINPHAGEGGLFGKEDSQITEPAVRQLITVGIDVFGPAGGDRLLASRKHDLYVAIFHDQGHIPIKLLSPNRASALSIGANVLMSSVGHGSAMDIAGKGVASPNAMIETIALLANITL